MVPASDNTICLFSFASTKGSDKIFSVWLLNHAELIEDSGTRAVHAAADVECLGLLVLRLQNSRTTTYVNREIVGVQCYASLAMLISRRVIRGEVESQLCVSKWRTDHWFRSSHAIRRWNCEYGAPYFDQSMDFGRKSWILQAVAMLEWARQAIMSYHQGLPIHTDNSFAVCSNSLMLDA